MNGNLEEISQSLEQFDGGVFVLIIFSFLFGLLLLPILLGIARFFGLYTCVREYEAQVYTCLLYTSPSPRDKRQSRMPSSA